MPWTGMRIMRLVAYGTGPTTVLTVALTAANSFHCAPGRSARSISHPCVAAASHLPCTRPPDTSRCLEYQRLLPKNAYCCLDLCSPFWRTSTTSSRHYSSFSARNRAFRLYAYRFPAWTSPLLRLRCTLRTARADRRQDMSDEAGLAAQDQGPRAAYVQDFKRAHLMIHTTTAVSRTVLRQQ